jgi:hypothetical protein
LKNKMDLDVEFSRPFRLQPQLPNNPFGAACIASQAQKAAQAKLEFPSIAGIRVLNPPLNPALGCKNNIDALGIGVRSYEEWSYGSSLNLPIYGAEQTKTCFGASNTGPKRFRDAFPLDDAQSKPCKCGPVDPTNPCTYASPKYRGDSGCNFGFQRNSVNWQSPTDGSRFSAYRQG